MKYVSFQTELFFTEIPDDQRDQWFVGADCSGWFYARLLPVPEIEPSLDPTMEDWGWVIMVRALGLQVDISIWEHFDKTNCWVFGIGSKKRFLRRTDPVQLEAAEKLVVKAVGDILTGDPRFYEIHWSNEHPLETYEPPARA